MQVITRQLGKGDMRWQSIMVKIRAARDAKRGIKANGAAVSEARPSPRSGDGKEVRSQRLGLLFPADAQPRTKLWGMAVICYTALLALAR